MTDLDMIRSALEIEAAIIDERDARAWPLKRDAALAALARVRRVVEGAERLPLLVRECELSRSLELLFPPIITKQGSEESKARMQAAVFYLADAVDALNPSATTDQGGDA